MYEIHTSIKVNSGNLLYSKFEIYGNSLTDKRICKAIKLIDKIQLK